MTRTIIAALLALVLSPSLAVAQADSARTDSAKTDSPSSDSTKKAKAAPKPVATPSPIGAPRTLGTGECPPAAARDDADALRRFSSPRAHGPVPGAKPVLRDPTLRGRAVLAFEIDTLGRPDSSSVRVVDGDPYLLPTARSSVARWRFRPAELTPGCRVRARVTETVTF